ncbi:MAG: 5-bromo-4-chloroindolyl phosphate hydrolysis family protein [Clostridiales bacterium]|nr:5-bromo-4-chloroindolyl phosphate hydrolysis family protein [Candidatus Cacconaster stercorequi]
MGYYYDESGNLHPKKQEKESDIGSWVFIGILFAVGLWPIGLIMLISKLTDDKDKKKSAAKSAPAAASGTEKRSKVGDKLKKVTKTPHYEGKGAKIMKWIGIGLLALGGAATVGLLGSNLHFYLNYPQWMLEELFYPVGLMAGGAGLLLGSRSMTRRARRFAKYLSVAGSNKSVSLERLAGAAEVSEKKLQRDLEIMIDKRMWGKGAYVDLGSRMLFRTAEAAAQYEALSAASHKSAASSTAPAETAQGYSGILRQIREANDRIADPVLSQKIDRLEEIAGRIFRIVESEPDKKVRAATFLNYYLPTTQKLLDSYAEFEEAGVSGTNLNQAKEKIEKTMDSIVAGFERQLDELYQDEAMDIDSDIRVMETMLRRDSASVEEDFGLGGTAAQTYEEE